MMKPLTALAVALVFAFGGAPAMASGSGTSLTGISSSAKGHEQCGGIAGIPCKSEDEYCKMENGTCQVADNMGYCHKKPEVCTDHIEYVCGCDGKTYGNPCEAAMAGMSIDHEGPCKDDPEEHDHSTHDHEHHDHEHRGH